MGTSSSYGGQTGGNKLLPPWAQDPLPSSPPPEQGDEGSEGEGEATPQNMPGEGEPISDQSKWIRTESWRTPKSLMRRYTSNGGNLQRTARSYVKAKGGARSAASMAVAGKRATARLGGFLSDIAKYGFQQAVANLGLRDVMGQSAEVVFASIAQVLSPAGATLEEHIARRATNDALAAVFEKYGASETDFNQLDKMNEEGIRGAIKDSVQNYIYQRWLQELGDRIEKHAVTAEQAVRMERDVRAYVKEAVKLDLGKMDLLNMDWNAPQIRLTMESIYSDAYQMLEVGE